MCVCVCLCVCVCVHLHQNMKGAFGCMIDMAERVVKFSESKEERPAHELEHSIRVVEGLQRRVDRVLRATLLSPVHLLPSGAAQSA